MDFTAATLLFVAFNCLPVTASVLDVLSAPSFRPVMLRTALDLLRASSTVPVFSPPKRTLPLADTWLTSPLTVLTLANAVLALVLAVVAVDCAAAAVVFAASAADLALVTFVLVALSCLPVTASVLDAESAPSFKPVMLRTALDLLRTSSIVPVFSPPSLTLPAADTWLTRPLTALAFASAVLALVLAVLAVDCAAVAVVFAASAAA
ncbi:hypothetical protein D3C73_815750 [compost metagenome]